MILLKIIALITLMYIKYIAIIHHSYDKIKRYYLNRQNLKRHKLNCITRQNFCAFVNLAQGIPKCFS